MAYITFIARKDLAASYALTRPTVLGRSLDCDIFVPDVFVSRKHCRFEQTDRGWMVEDTGSRNGMHFKGKRVKRRILHDGDVIELGTVAFLFQDAELDPARSNPAPFGEGPPVIEMVDTLYAEGSRASQFLKKNRRTPSWLKPQPAPIDGDDWTELDVELQIEAMTLYQPTVLPMPLGSLDDQEWTELDVELTEGLLPILPMEPPPKPSTYTPANEVRVEGVQLDMDLSALEDAAGDAGQVPPEKTSVDEDEPSYAGARQRTSRRPPPSYNRGDSSFSGGHDDEAEPAAAPAEANRWEKLMGASFETIGKSSDRGGAPAKQTRSSGGAIVQETTKLEAIKDRLGVLTAINPIELAREYPQRTAALAACVVVCLGLLVTWRATRNEYASPKNYKPTVTDTRGD
jgi:pSer/pThr/pTyr-binding forkhead associated (FHA) protein